VTVWPLLVGTLILLEGGVEAKLNMANKAPMEHKRRAAKVRGLKKADCELRFFFITLFL
jgi:hypothetical protein